MSKQLVLFILCGGTAAVANVLSRILFNLFVPFEIAVILAYGVGLVTAFTLNRLLVFTSATKPLGNQVMWFLIVNVVAVAQTLIISVALERWGLPWLGITWHPDLLAHMVGVAVPIASSFIGHKHLTFSEK